MKDLTKKEFIELFMQEAGMKFISATSSANSLTNCLDTFRARNTALKETRAIVNKDRAELREELTQQILAEIKDEYATRFARFHAVKDLTIGELVDEYV